MIILKAIPRAVSLLATLALLLPNTAVESADVIANLFRNLTILGIQPPSPPTKDSVPTTRTTKPAWHVVTVQQQERQQHNNTHYTCQLARLSMACRTLGPVDNESDLSWKFLTKQITCDLILAQGCDWERATHCCHDG